MLSPAGENVKVGLRETTQNTSPHLRSKTLVADAQAENQPPSQSPVQRQNQHQVRAASAHHHPDNQEVQTPFYKCHTPKQWSPLVALLLLCIRNNVIKEPFYFFIVQKPGRWESLQSPSLSRAHSLRSHSSSCGEEGLKRVCSAPQLGDQEKGTLLKRKLSVSDSEPFFVCSGGSKHKKQGERTFCPLQ